MVAFATLIGLPALVTLITSTAGSGRVRCRVHVFSVDIDCARHECRPAIAALGVALFEAEELELRLEEIEETHDGDDCCSATMSAG